MNMKYGRLFRGDVEYAPDSLEEKDGTVVSNPSAATYLAAGWKRVVDEPPAPVPGCTVCPSGWDEGEDAITYAVSCRHCTDPICVKSCIAGAIRKQDGVVRIDQTKCVGCLTCVLVCPYGALSPNENGVMQKCELCLENACEAPACVTGCPNRAIVYEEREEDA